MSQDTRLFSIKGPRETLGSIQKSSIPKPASAAKRTSSIGGLFGVAEVGLSSARRSVSSNMFHGASAGRQSFVAGSPSSNSAPQNVQRRSSVFSRPSIAGPMSHQTFFAQVPTAAGVTRDPRPLRDRAYQARICQELLEYLTHNKFEFEMKHILGRNTLRSPTQKDFTYIFQWLYHRIDPGYKFQKAVDSEVPTILRNLRYPYEKSITKSQIAAVGGQNWPIYFAMLHWLMQLAQMMERYVVGDYDEACLEAGVDITDDRITYASSLAPTTIGSRGEKMRMTAWRRSA